MTRLDFQDQGRGDRIFAVFRGIAAVGCALRPRLGVLFERLNDDGPGYQYVIDSMQEALRTAFAIGNATEARDYVLRAQDHIGSMAGSFPNAPHVGPLVESIAEDIRWVGNDECAEQLQQINEKAHHLAQNCADHWGCETAKHAYQQHVVSDLTIRREDGRPPTRYDRDEETIILPLGETDTCLYDYISIEFRLFHEYISHLFSRSDDLRRRYSDGHLFWLQQLTYPQINNIPALQGLINLHWDRQEQQNNSASSERDQARQCAEFFHCKCETTRRFPSLLLEIGLHPGRAQEVSLFVGRLNDIMTSTNESWRTAAKEALNDPKIDVGTIVDALGTIVRGPIDRFLKRYSP